MRTTSRNRGGGHLGQGGGPVCQGKTLGHRIAEIVAVERFRRLASEETPLQKSRDMRLGSAAGARERAVEIGGSAGMNPHPVVDQRIAGAGGGREDGLRAAG